MLLEVLLTAISNSLSTALSKKIEISDIKTVAGGSINEAYQLKTNFSNYFIKLNSLSRFPEMFEKEAEGLRALKKSDIIDVPDVILTDKSGDQAYIIMNFIESRSQGNDFWNLFGKAIAELHRESNNKFGFNSNNYIGSLSQSNNWHSNWAEFFIEERLEPLVKQARDKGVLPRETMSHFETLYSKLEDFFPIEKPSLLHGDLWSGNYSSNERGEPVIFDPAVYFGHREMDLGMSKLFGGFAPEFYEVYHDHYPLEKGWQERLEVANLYPLMVHVILFGGTYLYDVQRILKRMV